MHRLVCHWQVYAVKTSFPFYYILYMLYLAYQKVEMFAGKQCFIDAWTKYLVISCYHQLRTSLLCCIPLYAGSFLEVYSWHVFFQTCISME